MEYVTTLQQACASVLVDLNRLITDRDGCGNPGLKEGFSFSYNWDKMSVSYFCFEVIIHPSGWSDDDYIYLKMEQEGASWSHVGYGVMVTKKINFLTGNVGFVTSSDGRMKISSKGTADHHLYSLKWRWLYKPFRRFLKRYKRN